MGGVWSDEEAKGHGIPSECRVADHGDLPTFHGQMGLSFPFSSKNGPNQPKGAMMWFNALRGPSHPPKPPILQSVPSPRVTTVCCHHTSRVLSRLRLSTSHLHMGLALTLIVICHAEGNAVLTLTLTRFADDKTGRRCAM